MSGIMLRYRREDAAAYAGRLYDRLAAEFGREFEADPGPLSEKARASLDDEAFDGLPDEFASLDVVEAYRVVGRSRATAYRRIESWRESGKVEGVPGSPGRYRKAS